MKNVYKISVIIAAMAIVPAWSQDISDQDLNNLLREGNTSVAADPSEKAPNKETQHSVPVVPLSQNMEAARINEEARLQAEQILQRLDSVEIEEINQDNLIKQIVSILENVSAPEVAHQEVEKTGEDRKGDTRPQSDPELKPFEMETGLDLRVPAADYPRIPAPEIPDVPAHGEEVGMETLLEATNRKPSQSETAGADMESVPVFPFSHQEIVGWLKVGERILPVLSREAQRALREEFEKGENK